MAAFGLIALNTVLYFLSDGLQYRNKLSEVAHDVPSTP